MGQFPKILRSFLCASPTPEAADCQAKALSSQGISLWGHIHKSLKVSEVTKCTVSETAIKVQS